MAGKRRGRNSLRAFWGVLGGLIAMTILGNPARLTAAADPASPKAAPPIRAASERVVIPITVQTADGEVLSDIKAEELRLYINDREVKDFLFLQDQDAPVTVAVLLDQSASAIGKKISWVKSFLEGFFHRTEPKDAHLLATFGLQWKVLAGATSDRVALMEAVYNLDPGLFRDAKRKWTGNPSDPQRFTPFLRGFPPNKTAIALDRSFYELARVDVQKKAVLLVSDGDENLSRVTLDHIRYYGFPIFALYVSGAGFGERSLFRRGAMLSQVTAESGGARIRVEEATDPYAAGRRSADMIRNQILVSFVPPEDLKRSKTHLIKVECSRPGLRLSYRQSFRFTHE